MEPWEVKKKEFREMILAKPVLMQDWASYFQNAIYNVLLVTLI